MKTNKPKSSRLDSKTIKSMYESKTVELVEAHKLFAQVKKEYEAKEVTMQNKLEDVKKYYQDLVSNKDFRIGELEACKFTAPMLKYVVTLVVASMAVWSLIIIFLVKWHWPIY